MFLLGLSVLGFIADGPAAGTVYFAIGVGLVALLRWRILSQVEGTQFLLEKVLRQIDELEYEDGDEEMLT
jgi:hypothetical protein